MTVNSERTLSLVLLILSNISSKGKAVVDRLLSHGSLIYILGRILGQGSDYVRTVTCYTFGNAAQHASVTLIIPLFI